MAFITRGLSHHSAPVEARERLAFTDAELPAALSRLRALAGVDEAAILSTCNRTEILVVSPPLAGSAAEHWSSDIDEGIRDARERLDASLAGVLASLELRRPARDHSSDGT